MKRIFFTALLTMASFASFAATYNCANPNITYSYGGSTYRCGTTTEANSICYYYVHGSVPPGNNVTGCDTKAPINSGLVFLIIAAVGIGSGVLYKKDKTSLA